MKNKQIDHIKKTMSKRHGVFTENFTVFFFSTNAWKTRNVPEFEFDNSRQQFFGDYINVTFRS